MVRFIKVMLLTQQHITITELLELFPIIIHLVYRDQKLVILAIILRAQLLIIKRIQAVFDTNLQFQVS